MMPYWEPSSSTDKRKRVAELFPQHLAPRPSFFFRSTHPNAEKFCESQQLPVLPHINEVMSMILVQPTHPIQPASHTHALPIPFPKQPNQFEIGTTSTAVLTRAQRRNNMRNKRRRIRKRMWRENQEKEDKVMCETSPLPDSSRFHALSATDVLTNTPRRKRNRRVKKVMLREKQEKEDKVMCETSPLLDGGRFHALSAADVLANTQRWDKNRRIMKVMLGEKQEKEDKVMCETSPLLDGGRFHALSAADVLANTQRLDKNRRIMKVMLREKLEKEDKLMRVTSPLLDGGRFHSLSAADVLANTQRWDKNRRIMKMMLREKLEKEDKVTCETSPPLDGGRFHALSAADVLANTQRCDKNRMIMKMMLREKLEKEDKVMCETSPPLDGGRFHALSATAVLTNTQRRNKIRRINRRMSREKQEKEDKVMCETSPPLHGGRFHVLSATKGEEDVNKIVVSPEERAGKWEQHLGDVVRRTAETSIITKEEVIPRTKGIVSQSLVASLMEEDKTLAGNTLVVQPSSHNMQGFAGQSIVSAIVEGHDTESQHRLTASQEILLVDATISSPESPTSPKLSLQAHQMVSKPSNLKATREDGSFIPSNELRDQGHTLTSFPDVNRLSHTPQVPSSFEVENPTILPSTSVNHANNSNCEGKEPMKASSYQEYAPSLVNHGQPLSWKSIEELMQDLRENLRKMDEDDFDKDNDDLLDEDLCGVNSKSSSLLGDSYADELLAVKVEEDENIVLIQ